jgi:hypothetical protein
MELTTKQAPVEVHVGAFPLPLGRDRASLEARGVQVNSGFADRILVPCTSLLASPPGITMLNCRTTGDQHVSVLRFLQDAGYHDGIPPQIEESVVYDHVLQIAAAGDITQKHVWLFQDHDGSVVMASLQEHPTRGGFFASAFFVDSLTHMLCPLLTPMYMAQSHGLEP